MRKSTLAFFSVILTLLLSCDKNKSPWQPPGLTVPIRAGLPSDAKNINGYCFAAIQWSGLVMRSARYAYAAFGDPAMDLMAAHNHYTQKESVGSVAPNGSAGDVRIDGNRLSVHNTGYSISYNLDLPGPDTLNEKPRWTITGKKSFRPIDVVISRGFPSMKPKESTDTLFISKDLVLSLDTWVSNYDSVVVILEHNETSAQALRRVAVDIPGSQVTFPASELYSFQGEFYARLGLYAFNYAHLTLDDKKYVFELAKQNYMLMRVKP